MSESNRFIKFIPSEEAMYLLKQKPNAFRLLTIIAEMARRYEGHPDGLGIGEALIGDWKSYGMTEQNYRTSKKILEQRQHLKIIETNRNRKKSTTGVTTEGTRVKLLSSNVYDINYECTNDRSNDCLTTDQRLPNDELRKIKKDKKDKKDHHPSIPLKNPASELIDDDDFSSINKIEICKGVFLTQGQIDECVKIKGDIDSVKQAIEYIQKSEKREYEIKNWPEAIAKWKIPNKLTVNVKENERLADILCKTFPDFLKGNGWRCYAYHDNKKDQNGLLFESQSGYIESKFVPLVHGKFKEECSKILELNNMVKK